MIFGLVYRTPSEYTQDMPLTNATYLFLDLETTGLDPYGDEILESAYIVTDGRLTEIDAGSRVWSAYKWQLARMNPSVRDMHTRSGLLDEVIALRSAPHHQSAYVGFESWLSDVIDRFAWDGADPENPSAKRLPILAGSTISFDRAFVRADAPSLADRLHYRQLDVTSCMLLAQTQGATFERAGAHRAMPDIRESLERARFLAAAYA